MSYSLTQAEAYAIDNLMPGNQVYKVGSCLKYALDEINNITDNGMVITATATGIKSTVSTWVGTQWGDSAHHFHVTGAAPVNELGGAGYFQLDVTGSVAGTLYGFGAWVNMLASSVAGANRICAQDNGIWADATCNVSNSIMVIGMRMELVVDDGDAPGKLYLFSTNIYSNTLNAMFEVNAIGDLGGSTGTKSGGTARYIPFAYDVTAGATHYINTYTA